MALQKCLRVQVHELMVNFQAVYARAGGFVVPDARGHATRGFLGSLAAQRGGHGAHRPCPGCPVCPQTRPGQVPMDQWRTAGKATECRLVSSHRRNDLGMPLEWLSVARWQGVKGL